MVRVIKIYLPELELKKESILTSEASAPDLSITIENKKFKTKLFDKRDAFPFFISRIPHLDSNILSDVYIYSMYRF